MAFSRMIKETYQFQSIKSNKEVTLKTRETYFLYRNPQKLIFVKNVFRKLSSKSFSSRGKSHSAENTKKGSYCRNNKLGVAFKNGLR